MIITQTPFRMSFFGGGTDMESFFKEYGGAVLSTTFDKYCYVNVRHLPRFFDYSTELSYSKTERVTDINDIQHPAIRNAMKMLDIYDARTGMEYVLIGDYYLPALKVPRTRPVGRWGMLHKAYLKLRKPAYYQSLLLNGKLDAVLADVEEQAAERYEVLIEQMSQRESISEKLKEENQMEWVRRMSNLENSAAEIVKAELIYRGFQR